MPQDVLRPLGESGNSTRPVELIDALEGARFKRQAAQSLFINHCTQFGPVASCSCRASQFAGYIALGFDQIGMFKWILRQIEQLLAIAIRQLNVFPMIVPGHYLEPARARLSVITE